MKKSSIYFILFMLVLSCSKDDSPTEVPLEVVVTENPPSLTLVNGNSDTFFGIVDNPENGALTHAVKATAPDGFKSLVINKITDGVLAEYETIDAQHPDYVDNSTAHTYNLNYILNNTDVDHKISFNAVVTDKNNNTATLDFANALVEVPMLKTEVILESITPYDGSETRPFYLYIDGTAVEAVNYTQAKDSGKLLAAVFSFTKDDGFNLASPNAVFLQEMVADFTEKSSTKFKPANDAPYELALDSEYGIYDAHNIKSKFNALTYNDNEEKAINIGTPGVRYFFKTDDGRTGVFQVMAHETVGALSFLRIEILITNLADLG
ncbi:hypothetical protein [Spongiimicrobium sp. 3-5]|uniref:hypothetical protein n=1 Tax=Spongiimicrobium sp. 3-5 TaxID=3332596 RepID=UPI0039813C60